MLTISQVSQTYSQRMIVHNQKALSFGYKLPEKTFSDIRDIPKLNCACCGKSMMTFEEANELLRILKPSASSALKSNKLDEYKTSHSYEYLQKLAKKYPKKSVREILELPDVQADMQNLKLKMRVKIRDIADITDTMSVKAPTVIKKLEKYRPLLDKGYKEIVDLLEIYSLKYPKNTFSEIIQNPEVYEYHAKIVERHREKTFIQKVNTFKRIRNISEKLSDEDLKAIKETNSKAQEILNSGIYKNNIKKALIEALYKDFARNCSDKKTAKEILKASLDFPCDTIIPDAFLVNKAEKTASDYNILKEIISTLQATFEHIRAKSNDGKYVQENGIVLCKSCNQERANLPYTFFLKVHPEMKKNAQRQINKIISFLKGDKLIDYETYPVAVKETLYEETNHMIKLNIKKFFENKELRSQAELDEALARSEESEAKYQTAHKNFMEAQKKIKEALETINKLKRESSAYQNEANAAHQEKKGFEKIVNTAKENLKKIKQLRETDEKIT